MKNSPPGLSSKLRTLAAELRSLELELKSEADPDVGPLQEFRRALDNARLTAWTVSELINAREAGKNAEKVLTFLTTERLRRFTQMARELSAEMERGGLTWQTEGIRPLSEALILLQSHTAKLAARHRGHFRTVGGETS